MTEAPKVEKKNLAQVTIMLATFLLAVPMTPTALASPMAGLSISPSSITADPGSSFQADVMVAGASMLVAYDFKVLYDPNILQVSSATLGHTAFDLNNNGDISDDPVLVARHDVFNPIGVVRYAVVLLGGVSVSPTSASLLTLIFTVNNPLMGSASDLANGITIDSSLIGLDSSGAAVSIPHTVSGATFNIPADVGLRNVGCRATNNGFNIIAKGFVDGLFCRVVNGGSVPIDVRADFPFQSLNGVTGSVSSPVMTLQPGQAGELDASITVPNGFDVFIITGTPTRIVTFPDSSMALIAGPTDTTFINVNQ